MKCNKNNSIKSMTFILQLTNKLVYLNFKNFITDYKDAQHYVAPKIEFSGQAAFSNYGYFVSGTNFQN